MGSVLLFKRYTLLDNKMIHVTNLNFKITAFLVAVLAIINISQSSAQMSSYKIQSLFLYNFSKHVKWENANSGPFTIGVYGNEKAFEEIKANLEDKQAWGQNIQVIPIGSSADISKCHIAYLPMSGKKNIIDNINTGSLSNTLLVTEADMMNKGAAISFVYEESKMKFKISKEKIEQAGMKVSSSLLSIGIPV